MRVRVYKSENDANRYSSVGTLGTLATHYLNETPVRFRPAVANRDNNASWNQRDIRKALAIPEDYPKKLFFVFDTVLGTTPAQGEYFDINSNLEILAEEMKGKVLFGVRDSINNEYLNEYIFKELSKQLWGH